MHLQTVFASLMTDPKANLQSIVKALSTNARGIAEIDTNTIQRGNKADITIFSPTTKWQFTKDLIISQTNNSPFIDKELQGVVCAVVNNGKLAIRE